MCNEGQPIGHKTMKSLCETEANGRVFVVTLAARGRENVALFGRKRATFPPGVICERASN